MKVQVKIKGQWFDGEILEAKMDKMKIRASNGKIDWYENKEIKRIWS